MAGVTYDVKLDIQNALAGIQRIEGALGGLNNKMSAVSKATSTLATGFKALAGIALGSNVAGYAEELQNMENKLRVASKSQEEFNSSFQRVRAIADTTGQTINAVGSLYAKLALHADSLGYNQDQVTTATLAFSQALRASGASSHGAAQAIYQYTQILQKGKVNGDEFVAIQENMGSILPIVAKNMGVTVAQMFKMKEEGKLTASVFSNALIKSIGELNLMAGKMAPTVGQAMNRMSNSFGAFLHDLQASTGFFTKVANAVDFLARNFKTIITVLAAVAGAWAGAKIVAWGGMAIEAAVGVMALVKAVRALAVGGAVAEAALTGGISAVASLAGAAAAMYGMNKLFEGFDTTVGKTGVDLNAMSANAQKGLKDMGTQAEMTAKQIAQARKEYESIINSIARQIRDYKLSNEERIKGLQFDKESLRLSEQQRAVKSALIDLEKNYNQEIIRLREKYNDIVSSGTAAEKRALPTIAAAMSSVTAEYEKQRAAVVENTNALMESQRARQLELFAVQEQIRLQNDLQKIQDDIAKLTMTEIEQKYYDIEAAANASAKAAIEAEQARRNEKLSPQEIEQYYATARQGVDALKQKTKEHFDQSRSWNTGWKRAMNEYVANATNAARQAENIFKTATQGMEEAIVNFAKTGKFEWRNFVSMMLEELLRSQVQQLFANMMGGMRNTMSSFASGYMPGESGGIPTGGSGGGLLGGIIGGIGKLFGGFFANGGVLGAGKWGIAGEAGPEIIRGPATITPLNAGQTTVVYNINAVDAMSFKQLVARDPGFIYAVSQQGAKSIPNRR